MRSQGFGRNFGGSVVVLPRIPSLGKLHWCFVGRRAVKMRHHIELVLRFAFALLLWTVSAYAAATNVYVTPTGAPTGNCPAGTSSAPNLTAAQFSNSSNWGTGTGQIKPGTVVLLCGTFNGTAGATLLTFQGSGTSGSPITLLFDTGAIIQAPYFPATGAIATNNQSWLVIDGGPLVGGNTPNGTIQNTLNGTVGSTNVTCPAGTCTTANNSALIYGTGTEGNIIIERLSLINVYVHDGTGNDSGGSHGTYAVEFCCSGNSNITIHDVLCHDVFACFNGWGSNWLIYNTEGYYCSSHFWFEPAVNESNVIFHDNYSHCAMDISQATAGHDWTDSSDNNHGVDLVFFTNSPPVTLTNLMVYNNTFKGGAYCCNSGHIEMEGTYAGIQWFFNNVFDNINHINPPPDYHRNATALGDNFTDLRWFNNTFMGGDETFDGNVDMNVGGLGTITVTFQNNVVTGAKSLVSIAVATFASSGLNSNVYEDLAADSGSGQTFGYHGTDYTTLSSWQAATSQDANSVMNTISNLHLSSDGHLQTGSPAIGLGANLTSLGVAALNCDKPVSIGVGGTGVCNPRPSSGAWDAGSYWSGTSSSAPASPMNLSVTVQ